MGQLLTTPTKTASLQEATSVDMPAVWQCPPKTKQQVSEVLNISTIHRGASEMDDYLLDCLGALDHSSRIQEYYKNFVPGTRNWVFETFHEWSTSKQNSALAKNKVFVLAADAGMGKTAISAKLAVDFHSSILANHFCRHDNTKTSDPKCMLMSLATQLAARFDRYKVELYGRLKNQDADPKALHQEFMSPQYNVVTLFDALFLNPLSNTDDELDTAFVILIDALDEVEANGKNDFVDCIERNFPKLPNWLKVVVTTRPESPAIETLKKFKTFVLEPDNKNNEQDLETFYHFKLAELFPEEAERNEAVSTMTAKTRGNFVYAKSAVDKINDLAGSGLLSIESLESFPDGLEEFYKEQICSRVIGQRRCEHAEYKLTLEWRSIQFIVVAAAPPHKTLLQELLECTEPEVERVVERLSVFFPQSDGYLQVHHKSVKDWLTDVERKDELFFVDTQEAETRFAEGCLGILSSMLGVLAKSAPTSWSLPESPHPKAVLYTLHFMLHHVLHINSPKLLSATRTFFLDNTVDYILARIILGGDTVNLVQDILELGKNHESINLTGHALQLSQDPIRRNGWKHLPSQMVGRLQGPLGECKESDPTLNQPCEQEHPHPSLAKWWERWYGFQWWIPKVPTWEQADDSCQLTIQTNSRVFSTAVSPDCANVAIGLAGGNVCIFSMKDGTCEHILAGHSDDVNSVLWSPVNSEFLASGSDDKTVRIWNWKTCRCERILEGHSQWVTSVSWSPFDAAVIASGSNDETVQIWDWRAGRCEGILEGHSGLVRCVSWSPLDIKWLATASNDWAVRIWNWKTCKCEGILEGHSGDVNSVSWSSLDSEFLASGSSDTTIRIWNWKMGTCKCILNGHTSLVRSVSWSPLNGELLASGSFDQKVRIWNWRARRCQFVYEDHAGDVNSVSWSSLDTEWLASGSSDNTVRIWKWKMGKRRRIMEGHSDVVNSVSWSPLDWLATGSDDRTVRIWNWMTGKCDHVMEGHTARVHSVSWSPVGGEWLASGSDDKTVRVWNWKTGMCERILEGHSGGVYSVSWSPLNSAFLASGSNDTTVQIWNWKTGKRELFLEGHSDRVYSVSWSPLDSECLVSGSDDKTVRIWNSETGKCQCTLAGHSGGVYSVSWSPVDSELLAAGTKDKTIQIWNWKTCKCEHTLYNHNDWRNLDAMDWSELTHWTLAERKEPNDHGSTFEIAPMDNISPSKNVLDASKLTREALALGKKEHQSVLEFEIVPLDGMEIFLSQENHAAGVFGGKNLSFFELSGSESMLTQLSQKTSSSPETTNSQEPISRKHLESELRDTGHTTAFSQLLDNSIVDMFRHRPVDVFCIHAGVEKNLPVASMADVLTRGGFVCFLDREMSQNQGAPTEQMALALETCRHAVVVLSKAFLQKKHPCSELCYAFQRMEWVRKHYPGWESMRVILYDLTVEDYKNAQRSKRDHLPALPDLGPNVVMTKWREGVTWPSLCHDLKAELLQHDQDCAIKLWTQFLAEWHTDVNSRDFERALDIYS